MTEADRNRRWTVLIEATRNLPEVLSVGWDLVVTSRLIMGAPELLLTDPSWPENNKLLLAAPEAVWVDSTVVCESFPAHRLPGVGWAYTVETDPELVRKLLEELGRTTATPG